MRRVVVLCGAGRGERFGGDKVFATLWGRPLFYWSLKVFEESPEINEVVPVVRAGAIEKLRELCELYGIKKVKRIVAGGPRRQDSVMNGLEAVEDDALVFVHDAARPALTKALIKRLTAAYREGVDGVVPIVRPVDTVKETHNGLIKKTIQRDRLALVQTPQVFVASTLKRAYQAAEEEFTDDASAVEAAGGRVAIVQGERLNIKVTTREDLLILESIGRQICQN